MGFRKAINEIRENRRHQIAPFATAKRTEIADNLDWIRELGDTAAHLRWNRQFIRREPIESNLGLGKRKLEEVVSMTYGWPMP